MAQSPHQRWGVEALWQQLAPVLPRLSVEVLARCESTNTRLIERARAAGGDPDAPVTVPGALEAMPAEAPTPHGRRGGDGEPCLLVAEQQTHGRGRLGRGWESAAGASLTFSLALPLAPADWQGLSLAVGLALADALEPSVEGSAPRIGLKWPNDLLWAGGASAGHAEGEGHTAQPAAARKLGGVLIETVSVGTRRVCVVGVGLNVRPLPQPLATSLSQGFASLAELDPELTAPAALARVALPLARALKAFEREGFAPLLARYAARDVLRGREVQTALPPAQGAVPAAGVAGRAEGVDAQGALLLRLPNQELRRIVSGEVSVRPVAAATRPLPSAAER